MNKVTSCYVSFVGFWVLCLFIMHFVYILGLRMEAFYFCIILFSFREYAPLENPFEFWFEKLGIYETIWKTFFFYQDSSKNQQLLSISLVLIFFFKFIFHKFRVISNIEGLRSTKKQLSIAEYFNKPVSYVVLFFQ